MSSQDRGPVLRGRDKEIATLRGLLSAARSGSSQVLVLRGEAGVGKTALLRDAMAAADGFRCVHVTGVESDMELAYAGLQQLCAPLLHHLDELPTPQREALDVAFGRGAGAAPDRFLVGLAVLSLLAAATDDQPLLCVVDDAQWLDQVSVQTLAFVARRFLAEPIVLLFAARDIGAQALGNLPELTVTGLSDADARDLLDSVLLGRVDERVRDRLVAETRGIPLALLEVPRSVSAAELAGGFWNMGSRRSVTGQVEDSYRRRVEALPPATQQLLFLAAADAVVAPLLLARGVQNKLLEAMAMARPVVASAAAATGIDAAPGEHLLVADGADAMADAVVRLFDDPAGAAAMGRAARAQMIARYGWDAQLAPLARLLGLAA